MIGKMSWRIHPKLQEHFKPVNPGAVLEICLGASDQFQRALMLPVSLFSAFGDGDELLRTDIKNLSQQKSDQLASFFKEAHRLSVNIYPRNANIRVELRFCYRGGGVFSQIDFEVDPRQVSTLVSNKTI